MFAVGWKAYMPSKSSVRRFPHMVSDGFTLTKFFGVAV